MLQSISPLEGVRGLNGFKVLARPGKIRVIRHSPLKQKYGGDKQAEKDNYEDARISSLILLLSRWLDRADKQGIIRDVLLTEKYRLVKHGGRWHKEAIFDDLHKEIGSLSPVDERWDHGMLIGDFVASEVSWLRDELVDRQKEMRSRPGQPPPPPQWEGDTFIGSAPVAPLDRPNEFATTSPTSPKKRPGFTAKGRETLQSAGVVAEIEWGKNAIMVTCTLPGTSPEAYQLLADYSGEIMSRLWDRVRLHCKRKLGKPARLGWFYVWEKQNRGALHTHICLAANPDDFDTAGLVAIGGLIINWWHETLRKIGDENGINMFKNVPRGIDWSDRPEVWQSDITVDVKKSIARYISKYTSKDAAKERGATFEGDGDGYPTPKRWWGMNQVIRELIKKWTWELSIDCSNSLDIPLNELVHEALQVYQGECHTPCHTGLYKGIDKAKTDFWQVTKEVKVCTGEKTIKVNKTICNGITSTYLYSPQNYTEVFSQITELKSVIIGLAESAVERMTPWDERLPDEKEIPKPFLKKDKDFLRGIDPTDGKTIWDFERYWHYEEWKLMQEPWYWNETWRMANDETDWMVKVWTIYLKELQSLTKQNEYELRFGNRNQGPARNIDNWGEIVAKSAAIDAEMEYYAQIGAIPAKSTEGVPSLDKPDKSGIVATKHQVLARVF